MSDVMTVEALLARLGQLGVTLRVEGDQLVATPGGNLDDDLQAAIKAHKSKLMAMVRKRGQSVENAAESEEPEGSKYGFEPMDLPSDEQIQQAQDRAEALLAIIEEHFGFVEEVLSDYGATVFGEFDLADMRLAVDQAPPKILRPVTKSLSQDRLSWAYWRLASGDRRVTVNLVFDDETPFRFVAITKGIVRPGVPGWRTDGEPTLEGLIEALKAIGQK